MSTDSAMGVFLVMYALAFVVPIFAIYTERTDLRDGRLDFLKWWLANITAGIAGIFAQRFVESDHLPIALAIVSLILLYPFSRSLVRRCRDVGWNKNWAYVSVVPYVGGLLAIVILFWGSQQKISEPA